MKTLHYVLLMIPVICLYLYYMNNQSEVHRGSLIKVFSVEDAYKQPLIPKMIGIWQELVCAKKNLSFVIQEDSLGLPLMHSWAKLHPENDVWFIVTSPYLNDPTGMVRNITRQYKNVRLIGANLDETFKDVPLRDLFQSYKWIKQSDYSVNKLSDLLRVVLVYKYGGLYTDSDIIALRRFPKDVVNAVAFSINFIVSNGIIRSQARNQVFWNLMQDISKNFNGKAWASEGPLAMTRVMARVCNVKDFKVLNANEIGTTCGNITFLPAGDFYPIPWTKSRQYTEEREQDIDIHKKFNSSLGLHFWNALTKKTPIKIGGRSIVDLAAKASCPLTYESAVSHSKFL